MVPVFKNKPSWNDRARELGYADVRAMFDDLWVEKKISSQWIADRCGVTRNGLMYALKGMGYQMRARGWKRGKTEHPPA